MQSRDSQESSLTPQLESIDSLVLSFLYRAALTPVHAYWRKQSFDYMGLVIVRSVAWGLKEVPSAVRIVRVLQCSLRARQGQVCDLLFLLSQSVVSKSAAPWTAA